jgi:hypothetical protein
LIDTGVRRAPDRTASADVISVASLSHTPRDLNSWVSTTRQSLKHDGLKDIEEKALRTGDETIVRLGL